jgi:hypothetical protein
MGRQIQGYRPDAEEAPYVKKDDQSGRSTFRAFGSGFWR